MFLIHSLFFSIQFEDVSINFHNTTSSKSYLTLAQSLSHNNALTLKWFQEVKLKAVVGYNLLPSTGKQSEKCFIDTCIFFYCMKCIQTIKSFEQQINTSSAKNLKKDIMPMLGKNKKNLEIECSVICHGQCGWARMPASFPLILTQVNPLQPRVQ